jgi:hypothetical protein
MAGTTLRVSSGLVKNVRLGYKWVAGMNTLAYDSAEFISTVESFTLWSNTCVQV